MAAILELVKIVCSGPKFLYTLQASCYTGGGNFKTTFQRVMDMKVQMISYRAAHDVNTT